MDAAKCHALNRKKRRLWATYQKSKDYEEYLAYKRVEAETRRLVRQAKRKFEKKLAKEAKRKPKMFYSYLKSKTSNRVSVGPLKENEQVISDDTGMANRVSQKTRKSSFQLAALDPGYIRQIKTS